jgi:hypothetical protein
METLVRLEQREKALSPTFVTDGGDDGVLASSYQCIAFRMDYGIAILSGVIDLVVLGNVDAREVGATLENSLPNLRHRFWDENAR